MQRAFLLVSLCGLFAVLGLVARERTAHATQTPAPAVAPAEVASVWSASAADVLAIERLDETAQEVDRGLAPVISDSDLRARVVQFTGQRWVRFANANRGLMEDAAAHHGLGKDRRCFYDAAHVAWVATNS